MSGDSGNWRSVLLNNTRSPDSLSAAARLLNDPGTPVEPFIRALRDEALHALSDAATAELSARRAQIAEEAARKAIAAGRVAVPTRET